MTYKTKGIILRRTNLGEADRILTIYTHKHGKIKAIAKGIRKILSRLAGRLELFCLVDLVIAEGRNLDIVTDAETLKCFFKLRSNLSSTHNAYYLADVIDKFTAENEANPRVFSLLEQVLENLDGGTGKLLISYFEINLLSELGYHPELGKCLFCGKKITQGGNSFSFKEGGLICCDCPGEYPISDSAIKALRLLLKHNIAAIAKVQIDFQVCQEVEKLLRKYLQYMSHEELKSQRFL